MLKRWWLLAYCLVALTLSACTPGMSFTEMLPSTLPEDRDSGRIFFHCITMNFTVDRSLNPDIRPMALRLVLQSISRGVLWPI